MSEWKAKRFWSDVATNQTKAGFEVLLDGRSVRTPAKTALILPTEQMAQAVAEEWRAQAEDVDPATMPMTRSANSAIDRVTPQLADVAALIAAYGDSDLLCYRADGPEGLIARQALHWDPALAWAANTLGAQLETRAGVMHQPQPADALHRLTQLVQIMEPFHLTGFHDLVGLSGSLVLGFAAAQDWRPSEEIWDLSRLDEEWQAEQWGVDEEAAQTSALKRAEFLHAKRFFDLSGPIPLIG